MSYGEILYGRNISLFQKRILPLSSLLSRNHHYSLVFCVGVPCTEVLKESTAFICTCTLQSAIWVRFKLQFFHGGASFVDTEVSGWMIMKND
jgi:hypothetical protein